VVYRYTSRFNRKQEIHSAFKFDSGYIIVKSIRPEELRENVKAILYELHGIRGQVSELNKSISQACNDIKNINNGLNQSKSKVYEVLSNVDKINNQLIESRNGLMLLINDIRGLLEKQIKKKQIELNNLLDDIDKLKKEKEYLEKVINKIINSSEGSLPIINVSALLILNLTKQIISRIDGILRSEHRIKIKGRKYEDINEMRLIMKQEIEDKISQIVNRKTLVKEPKDVAEALSTSIQDLIYAIERLKTVYEEHCSKDTLADIEFMYNVRVKKELEQEICSTLSLLLYSKSE